MSRKIYEYVCDFCGKKSYSKHKKSNSKNHFCSKTCELYFRYKEKNLELAKCIICNKYFYKKFKTHLTCSKECKDINSKNIRDSKRYDYVCDMCDKDFEVNYKKKGKNVFCSHECSVVFNSKNHREIRNCIICGKEFESLKHENKKTCSFECMGKHRSITFVGKDSPTYNHDITDEERYINCAGCGEIFYSQPRGNIKNKQKYCSRRCALVNMITTLTIPHAKVCDILLENVINFEIEYPIGKYSLDVFITDKLAIEVMGAYWHCDIRNYEKPKNEKQEKNILKDKLKKEFIFKEIGCNVLYLWEDDINKNSILCENIINKYVENNGVLNNYHSINYNYENNVLNLNDNILVPFFEK